jgi:hypothetical protein
MTQEPEQHWCPACDEGWVEPLYLEEDDAIVGWLCAECEAFWEGEKPTITADDFVQLSEWLEE